MFVGWDWASTTHDVTVLDDAGAVVDQWAPPHTEAGLADTPIRLARHGQPNQLPVAIEQSSGLVVDRLLAAGHPVVPVHASAFHAARPRWGAAGAKSDPGDSYKLADYLRTDGHRLRRLDPLDDATRELQALVRLREDHVKAKTAASNQLGALLDAHWPGAKQVFSRLASEIALAFLEAYPTPQAAARLSEVRLAAFCRRHSYRGGRSPAELLTRLRAAPTPPLGLAPETLTELVRAQVRLLRTLLGTIADLDRALAAGLVGHAKARLLAPMPRIGEVNLAQIVAEVGPILERVDTVEQAIAECGAAPVTRASGKTRTVGSAGPPTGEHEPRRTPSPTTPGTPHPGPPGCMPMPAGAASTTRMRSGSSLVLGCGSSGPAGTPTPPTTRPATAPNNASPPELDSGNSSARSLASCSVSWSGKPRPGSRRDGTSGERRGHAQHGRRSGSSRYTNDPRRSATQTAPPPTASSPRAGCRVMPAGVAPGWMHSSVPPTTSGSVTKTAPAAAARPIGRPVGRISRTRPVAASIRATAPAISTIGSVVGPPTQIAPPPTATRSA
jgi:transposase